MFAIDIEQGWQTVPQTSGVTIKPLSGDFDESAGTGFRTRFARFAAGGETFAPFTHTYWEEALLVEGELTHKETGETLRAPAYVIRPPGTPHGPLRSEHGCLLIETQYFAKRLVGQSDYLDHNAPMLREGAAGSPADAEVFGRLMRSRFSCRAFLPDPVPEDVITRIIDTARWAASWSNVQPWNLIITRPQTTGELAEVLMAQARSKVPTHTDMPYPPAFEGVYLRRRREVGFGLYNALSIRRDDRAAREAHHVENFRFFGAPHVALLTMPANIGPYGALDLGNFIASFLLAARAEGVATLSQAALAQHSGAIRKMFDLPDSRAFVCGIAFGRADMQHPANKFRANRASVDEIFRFA